MFGWARSESSDTVNADGFMLTDADDCANGFGASEDGKFGLVDADGFSCAEMFGCNEEVWLGCLDANTIGSAEGREVLDWYIYQY